MFRSIQTFSLSGSGDLIADRRYAYAEGAFREGDWQAALDLYTQTLERVPHWPPARLGLGKALVEQGEREAAIAAFQGVAQADPDDRLGARAWLGRLGAEGGAMASGYVAALFDEYAPRFDTHLTAALDYRAPELIAEALSERAGARVFARAVDLGCGTGLMARAMTGRANRFDGHDLSARMLERAQETGLYSRLDVAECTEWLAAEPAASADLVLAADVFCYIADLQPVFRQTARVLAEGGMFAFTIQRHEGAGMRVGDDLRVHHGMDHIAELAAKAGLAIALAREVSARQDRGQPVPGALFILMRNEA